MNQNIIIFQSGIHYWLYETKKNDSLVLFSKYTASEEEKIKEQE